MDKLKEEIKKGRKITDRSLASYVRNIGKLSKSSSIFDHQKLDFFNNYYLQKENNYKKLR